MKTRLKSNLRKKNIPSMPLRSRRTLAPPKKDDFSELTWKERQMIQKAQLASLRQSPKNGAGTSKPKNGKPAKIDSKVFAGNRHPSTSSSRTSQRRRSCRQIAERQSPLLQSPRTQSRQSFGSIGSFSDILPRIPTSTTGFAARKSAYVGNQYDESDEDEKDTQKLNNDSGSSDSNSDDELTVAPSKKLPPLETMPTTEDFITYIITKGVNCVSDRLKFIGNLIWEPVRVRRKNSDISKSSVNNRRMKKRPMSMANRSKQITAKKVIAKAKRSLKVTTKKNLVPLKRNQKTRTITTVVKSKANLSRRSVKVVKRISQSAVQTKRMSRSGTRQSISKTPGLKRPRRCLT